MSHHFQLWKDIWNSNYFLISHSHYIFPSFVMSKLWVWSQNCGRFLQSFIISISSEAANTFIQARVIHPYEARLRGSLNNMAEERKIHRGGQWLRHEPKDMKAITEDPTVMEEFRREIFLCFCEKFQGCHTQVSKEFSMNFNGTTTKMGMLSSSITPEVISTITEIPRGQET